MSTAGAAIYAKAQIIWIASLAVPPRSNEPRSQVHVKNLLVNKNDTMHLRSSPFGNLHTIITTTVLLTAAS